MLAVRSAGAADVETLHPEAAGTSYRAWVVELEGKPSGVIGLALTRPRACLFAAFDEELRPHLKSMAVMRLVKKVQTIIQERARPVFAIRDPNEDRAPAILKRLGFEYVGMVDGDEIYEWEPD